MTTSKPNGFITLSGDEIVEVKKSHFFDGMTLPVDVYLSVNASSFVLIGKAGEKSQFSQLQSFKKPESKVFVLKNDHGFLTNFLATLTEKIVGRADIAIEPKVQMLSSLTSEILGELDRKSVVDFQKLSQVSKIVLNFFSSGSELSSIVNALAEMPKDEARHSIATSILSLAIGDEMGITQQTVLDKLSFAALTHDIGLKRVPKAILEKPKHLWNEEEIEIYQQHPMYSVDMLKDLKEVSNDVLLMIAEHHENALGTGYPKKIRDVKTSPLGRILVVADFYTELVFGMNENSREYSPDEALEYIEMILGQPFNKQVFRALKNLVNKAYLHKTMAG